MNNIYITCAPFKIKCSGDYDYLSVFKNTYNKLFNNNKIIELNCKNNDLQKYYINEFTKNVHNKLLFMKSYKNVRYNKLRKYEILNFLNIIKKNKHISKLIIQYRAPETGCLFYPEDIDLFKKNNIEVIIVCHEFYINILRSYLKNMTIKVLNKANIVFFFNEIDYKEAVKYGFKGIHYFTKVPVLLNMPNKLYIPTLNREENILFFGLIRPSKGFLNILLLAKLLYEKKDKRKVIIIGKCEIDNILIKRWIDKINIDLINDKLQVNNKYSYNLEIYVNPNDNLLFKMANRCQFAYKSDAKGFAFNSSSLINILYLGCILITKSSIFTPSFLLNSESKYYGAIIFQDKKTNNILNNKVPDPLFVYNKITNLTIDEKKNIIMKTYLLLNDYFNKINIIKDFNNNLVKLSIYKKT
jgi:hypothetical protein